MKGPYSVHEALAAPPNGATFVSAYSGCGGLDLGFRMAGFEPVWANEINPSAAATYRELLGDHIVVGDIDADSVELPDEGSADLVIGGPPCQGFSVAGRMDPHDPRSRHVQRFLDLVERVQPQAFVMENVKALAVSDRWSGVRDALEERAARMEYETSLVLLNAADVRVPQRRERMFLIGIRDASAPIAIPTEPKRVTVRDAFSWLPPVGEPGNATLCKAVITPAKNPVLRPTAHQGSLLFNGNGRPLRLDLPAPTLPAAMGGNATPIVDQHELETGEPSWVVEYHQRLLAGRAPLRRAPKHLRRVTVEEAAQLQSFPLGMTWCGPTGARFKQIGNSVPPLLALAVAKAVSTAIGAGSSEASNAVAA